MTSIFHDFRFAIRSLFKNWGFSLIVISTLALGIGVNTAMFTIVNAILIRPLPYPESNRLVVVWTRWTDFSRGSISQPEYLDILQQTVSFEEIGLQRGQSVNLVEGEGDPEKIAGVRVTPSLLNALGVQPLAGRLFRDDEGTIGSQPAAILSHALWQRRWGGDRSVLGKRIGIGGEPYEIVGVMPEGFHFPEDSAQVWTSYQIDAAKPDQRGSHSSSLLARLKPGVTIEEAQSELDRLAEIMNRDNPVNYPEGSGFGLLVQSYREVVTGDTGRALWTLLGAVGFVLLIACTNVAGLLLARLGGRRRELAVRSALGASRRRIVQQVLTESLVLAILGGIVALILAPLALQALLALEPGGLPRIREIQFDLTVLLFNGLLVLISSLAFGVAPALRSGKVDLTTRLKEGGRGQVGTNQTGRSVLVVAEIALATMLLVGAGLMIQSMRHILSVNPGFEPGNLVTGQLSVDRSRYDSPQKRATFTNQLMNELRAQPDIESAAAINILPLSGNTSDWSLAAEGYSEARPDLPEFIQYRVVTPAYFRTLQIPIVRGREFEDRDNGQNIAILSSSVARRFWGEADPLGRRIKPGGLNSSAEWLTIVGVVGDVRHGGLGAPEVPIWYRPYDNDAWSDITVIARARSGALAVLPLLRETLKRVDPFQPLDALRPMQEVVTGSLAGERFRTVLFLLFAALALALASVGIYGLMAYTVSQRREELGLRVALGARQNDIRRLILARGMLLASAGAGAGVLGALALARFLESLLVGVSTADPVTFVLAAILILLIALLACLVPARRATRINPLSVLGTQ